MKDEALKLALEGAANYIDALGGDSRKYRQALAALVQKPHKGLSEHMAQALRGMVRIDPVTGDVGIGTIPAQPARVQPDWKSEYQKSVELHCITLDELREAYAWIKNLEKLMADQDVMLTRQAARIVGLQEHIENFDGEDR